MRKTDSMLFKLKIMINIKILFNFRFTYNKSCEQCYVTTSSSNICQSFRYDRKR